MEAILVAALVLLCLFVCLLTWRTTAFFMRANDRQALQLISLSEQRALAQFARANMAFNDRRPGNRPEREEPPVPPPETTDDPQWVQSKLFHPDESA